MKEMLFQQNKVPLETRRLEDIDTKYEKNTTNSPYKRQFDGAGAANSDACALKVHKYEGYRYKI